MFLIDSTFFLCSKGRAALDRFHTNWLGSLFRRPMRGPNLPRGRRDRDDRLAGASAGAWLVPSSLLAWRRLSTWSTSRRSEQEDFDPVPWLGGAHSRSPTSRSMRSTTCVSLSRLRLGPPMSRASSHESVGFVHTPNSLETIALRGASSKTVEPRAMHPRGCSAWRPGTICDQGVPGFKRLCARPHAHDEVVLEDEKYSESLVEQAIEAMLHKRQLAARLLRPCALCDNGTRAARATTLRIIGALVRAARRVGPRTPS